jgi:hypothetical protein
LFTDNWNDPNSQTINQLGKPAVTSAGNQIKVWRD